MYIKCTGIYNSEYIHICREKVEHPYKPYKYFVYMYIVYRYKLFFIICTCTVPI